jgi:hypothetical protein
MEWKWMWKETNLMRISQQPTTTEMTDQKHLENVEYLNYVCSLISYARSTCEIKSTFAMAKVTFNKQKALGTSKWA